MVIEKVFLIKNINAKIVNKEFNTLYELHPITVTRGFWELPKQGFDKKCVFCKLYSIELILYFIRLSALNPDSWSNAGPNNRLSSI